MSDSCNEAQAGIPRLTRFFSAPKVILAPMAGITDVVFRDICLEQGAQLTYTEMVSAKGLSYANERTHGLLALADHESCASVQLFGHEPDVMAEEAARIADELQDRLFAVDINMGCPARKITSKLEGSALMGDPALAAAIVSHVKQSCPAPVTVKIRRGIHEGEETCVDLALRLEDAGADALCVHGRYADQLYRGKTSWEAVARVKAAVSIPVIGNGDVRCAGDARALLVQTGCDAVMIGRAAIGNPWVFAEVRAALDAGSATTAVYTAPTRAERMALATAHAERECALPGGAARMRRIAMAYVSGIPGASHARERLCSCSSADDFARVFAEVAAYAS